MGSKSVGMGVSHIDALSWSKMTIVTTSSLLVDSQETWPLVCHVKEYSPGKVRSWDSRLLYAFENVKIVSCESFWNA